MNKLTLLLATLAACHRDEPKPPPPQPAPAPVAAAPVAAPAPEATAMQPASDVRSLIGRMQYEVAHRPTAQPNADRALDAVEQTGLALDARKQYLASTVKAAYCVGGTTTEGIAVSACEYETPAAAAAGLAYMNDAFKHQLAKRELKGTTVLSIVSHGDTSVARVDAAYAKFSSL
jgi:hypothetical protein